MTNLPSPSVIRKAFAEKDASFDGLVFIAVKTTGVFCRPICRAKPARPENLEFFPSARAALAAGFRPCKLCRPLDIPGQAPPLVARLLELFDTRGTRWTESRLRAAGFDPSTVRRQFLSFCGMTLMQYQRAQRKSKSSVSPRLTQLISSPVGKLLAVVQNDALIALCFFDSPDDHSPLTPGRHPILTQTRDQLAEYFAGVRRAFSIPLSMTGTDFQKQTWQYLTTIPFGQTRSYADQARGIKNPAAVRAVGRANGVNPIALIVPCHRVIGADGQLTGYGGGMERKRWLLRHEGAIL